VVFAAMLTASIVANKLRSSTKTTASAFLLLRAPAPVVPFRGSLERRRLLGWNLSRHLLGGSSLSADNQNQKRWNSAVGGGQQAAKKQVRVVPRSLDEAFGGRRPPPALDFHEDADEIGSYGEYRHKPTIDGPRRPASSWVDQEPRSRERSAARPAPSSRPNFAAVPDFREGAKTLFTADDDDDDDDENDGPLIEEQRVSDLLQYRPSASNQRPPLRSTARSNVAAPDSYVTKNNDSEAPKAPAFPAYVPPTLEELVVTIETLLAQITAENNGKAFNINSPSQVATVLFGSAKTSTRKDVLDAMAGAGNRMADLILKYREAKNKLAKLQRRNESVAKGTAVKSAVTVKRVYNGTVSTDDDERDPLILVDVSAYIFRAYYSMYDVQP
jgi:hypothetical protein